jgi:hypothetical protein
MEAVRKTNGQVEGLDIAPNRVPVVANWLLSTNDNWTKNKLLRLYGTPREDGLIRPRELLASGNEEQIALLTQRMEADDSNAKLVGKLYAQQVQNTGQRLLHKISSGLGIGHEWNGANYSRVPEPHAVGPPEPGERIHVSKIIYSPREQFSSDHEYAEHRAELNYWYHNQIEPYGLGDGNQHAFDIRVRDSCPRPNVPRVEISNSWDFYPENIFPVWRSSALEEGYVSRDLHLLVRATYTMRQGFILASRLYYKFPYAEGSYRALDYELASWGYSHDWGHRWATQISVWNHKPPTTAEWFRAWPIGVRSEALTVRRNGEDFPFDPEEQKQELLQRLFLQFPHKTWTPEDELPRDCVLKGNQGWLYPKTPESRAWMVGYGRYGKPSHMNGPRKGDMRWWKFEFDQWEMDEVKAGTHRIFTADFIEDYGQNVYKQIHADIPQRIWIGMRGIRFGPHTYLKPHSLVAPHPRHAEVTLTLHERSDELVTKYQLSEPVYKENFDDAPIYYYSSEEEGIKQLEGWEELGFVKSKRKNPKYLLPPKKDSISTSPMAKRKAHQYDSMVIDHTANQWESTDSLVAGMIQMMSQWMVPKALKLRQRRRQLHRSSPTLSLKLSTLSLVAQVTHQTHQVGAETIMGTTTAMTTDEIVAAYPLTIHHRVENVIENAGEAKEMTETTPAHPPPRPRRPPTRKIGAWDPGTTAMQINGLGMHNAGAITAVAPISHPRWLAFLFLKLQSAILRTNPTGQCLTQRDTKRKCVSSRSQRQLPLGDI